MRLLHSSDVFAELRDTNQTKFLVKKATNLSQSTSGYSPILNFDLPEHTNLTELTERAQKDFECELDGEIEEDEFQRVVCMRSPDGMTFAFTQVLKIDETEIEYE